MSLPANATYFKLLKHKTVGAEVRTARVAKGLTGKDAAELVGLSQPQLSRIENGHQEFFTDKGKDLLTELMRELGVTSATWVEADWREGKRSVKEKKVTTPVRPVAAAALVVSGPVRATAATLDSRTSVTTLLDLYDAGVLDRAVILDALTNLTKELP